MAGWIFDIPELKSVFPQFASMKFNTAICFVLFSISLLKADFLSSRRAVSILPLLLSSIAALEILEYASGLDLGIDTLIFPDAGDASVTANPGRMSLSTAISFFLLGVGILLSRIPSGRDFKLHERLALLVLCITLPGLFGYAFGASEFYAKHPYFQIALHTSIGLFLGGVGLLFVLPDQGLASMILGKNLGAILIRKYLPVSSTFLFALFLIRMKLQNLNYIDLPVGVTLMASIATILFAVLLYKAALQINREEQKILQLNKEVDSFKVLKMALEAGKMAAWSLNLKTKMAWRSDNHDRIFGYPENIAEWTLDTFMKHVVPEDQDRMRKNLSKFNNNQTEECRILCADQKTVKWVEIHAQLFVDSGQVPTHMMGIIIDITDRKAAQTLLNEQLKMASLGEMASGIAHEINNPLAIISGKMENLKLKLKGDDFNRDEAIKYISSVNETVMRISKIIKGLKAFSRNSTVDPMVPTSMDSVFSELTGICSEKFKKHNVALRIHCEDRLLISCRSFQIVQVLVNLLNNSFDAIEGSSEKWIEISAKRDGPFVSLKITDSGKGIPSSVTDKIMNPFFTTKPVGKGTGLGLSISQGIIGEHGGSLAYNPNSSNTQFIIRLPLAESGVHKSAA